MDDERLEGSYDYPNDTSLDWYDAPISWYDIVDDVEDTHIIHDHYFFLPTSKEED